MNIIATRGKVDTYGRQAWFYKFILDNSEDFTEHMTWLNGRVYKNGIRLLHNPQQLYELFQGLIRIGRDFDLGGGLGFAQEKIDKCNNHSGCDKYCSKSNIAMCDKLKNHNKQIGLSTIKQEFVHLPMSSYTVQ